MEEIFLRFPHIGEQIFGEIDNRTITKCIEVTKSWQTFLSFRIINMYTDLSKPMIKQILDECPEETAESFAMKLGIFCYGFKFISKKEDYINWLKSKNLYLLVSAIFF